MKSMKLYDNVQRIHNELAALGVGRDAALRLEQLIPFDQYHYFGTEAMNAAIEVLELAPGARVLDIGSGIGGPARYLAAKAGVHVTALELQPDLHELGRELTARCGLAGRVEHVCGDILQNEFAGEFDAIISFLCFLHIADRPGLFGACRRVLKPTGRMFIEDFGKRRTLAEAETKALAEKVQCPFLPSAPHYMQSLTEAGFAQVTFTDVTQAWTAFTVSRLDQFRSAREQNLKLHGAETVDGLDDFYGTVANLFLAGAITGLTIVAS